MTTADRWFRVSSLQCMECPSSKYRRGLNFSKERNLVDQVQGPRIERHNFDPITSLWVTLGVVAAVGAAGVLIEEAILRMKKKGK
jgi:hypothetical protein